MTKEIKGIITMIAKAIIVAFAIAGVLFASGKVKMVDYDEINLIAVNGNTNSEYILEIGGEQYYKQNSFNYYFAQNQDLSK